MSCKKDTVTISTEEYLDLNHKSEMYKKALDGNAVKVTIIGVTYKR